VRSRGVGTIAARVAGACVLALAPAIGLAGCGGTAERPRAAESGEPSAFSVLRAARTSSDAVPLSFARDLLRSSEPNLYEPDIEGARKVLSHQLAWLVPGPGGALCLVRVVYPLVSEGQGERLPASLGRVCSSEGAAREGRLMETQSLSTTFAKRLPTLVDGIVPDGVHRVVVHSIGGVRRAVPVVRNAYEAIAESPRSISFVAPQAGRRRPYVVLTPSTAGGRPYPTPSHRTGGQ
jgi:hypothetical protein